MDYKELEKLLKDQKKRKFSKKIVSMIIVGSEPMALIGAWFAFTTGELWMLSSIKKTEVKEGENNDEHRDI